MGKNILEKMLAEYDQNIDGILKKCGGRDGLDEISRVFSVYNIYGAIEEWFKAVTTAEKSE